MKIITTVIALGFVNNIYACSHYLTNIHNKFHNMVGAPLPEGEMNIFIVSNNGSFFSWCD
jgi:hypothetical protein